MWGSGKLRALHNIVFRTATFWKETKKEKNRCKSSAVTIHFNVAPSYGYHIDGNDSALPGMVLALGPASAPLLLISGKILLYTRQRGMSIAAFHDCEHMVLDCGIPTGSNPPPVRSGFRISVVLTGRRRVHAIPSGKQYVVATDHHGASSRNVHTTGQKRAYKVAQDIKEYLLTS